MENNKSFRDRESGRVIGGLILVAVGAAFLLRNTFSIPNVLFDWPVLLILLGVYIGFKHNFRNNAWFVLMAVGGIFLVSHVIPEVDIKQYWPVIIIVLGISFILKSGRNKYMNVKTDNDYNKWGQVPVDSSQDPGKIAFSDTNDYLDVDSVFSGVHRNIVSKNFRGGHIKSVFGGAKIDLRQADITGPVVIKLDIVFGGTKLIVPPHWTIQNESNGAFHGVDDKRNFNPSTTMDPDKVIILKGSVVFGGLEITNY